MEVLQARAVDSEHEFGEAEYAAVLLYRQLRPLVTRDVRDHTRAIGPPVGVDAVAIARELARELAPHGPRYVDEVFGVKFEL